MLLFVGNSILTFFPTVRKTALLCLYIAKLRAIKKNQTKKSKQSQRKRKRQDEIQQQKIIMERTQCGFLLPMTGEDGEEAIEVEHGKHVTLRLPQGREKHDSSPSKIRRKSSGRSQRRWSVGSGTTAATVSTAEDEGEVWLSPYVKYESDGYRWPDLYTELDEMLEPNILIYPLAELRRLAREMKQQAGMDEQNQSKKETKKKNKKNRKGADADAAMLMSAKADQLAASLKLPLTHTQIMNVIEQNRKLLEDTKFGKEFYVQVLKAAEERNMTLSKDSDKRKKEESSGSKPTSKEDSSFDAPIRPPPRRVLLPETIIAFDDEFEQEELVYMVDVSHRRRRVTVTFRGSVTKLDWATDFQIWMKEVDNPVLKYHRMRNRRQSTSTSTSTPDEEGKTVKIHHGFYKYMFQPNRRGATGPNGESLSEYQEILLHHILPVLKQYPGYKVSFVFEREFICN